MVFSLFKKPQEKMPERQVARPKTSVAPPSAASDADKAAPEYQHSKPGAAGAGVPVPANPPAKQEPPSLDFTDSQFDDDFNSPGMGIEVEHDVDPVQADIEQAAVLFANGQDQAARAVLEAAARAHTGQAAERLWRMLLDLMQVLGDRAAFDKLGMEFAQVCETSSPTWRLTEKAATAAKPGEATLVLQGVVAGGDAPEIEKIKAALATKKPLRIELGKLAGIDDDAAGAFGDLLRLARKQKVEVTLDGADGLISRLAARLAVGQAESAATWLLLLELYQQLGDMEAFEEKAVDYAVTFEVSPPSWEVVKMPAKAPAAAAAPSAAKADDALYLTGELKTYRFDELPAYFEAHSQPILDFSRVKRMDFFSAGLLRNTLDPLRSQGKEVVIRNPHHLVAELMGIVGLNNVARIIVPKF